MFQGLPARLSPALTTSRGARDDATPCACIPGSTNAAKLPLRSKLPEATGPASRPCCKSFRRDNVIGFPFLYVVLASEHGRNVWVGTSIGDRLCTIAPGLSSAYVARDCCS